ncbi:hypothetical protein [Microbacterium sp. p3-SID131]|uniref:hypothetical protein n=1 Tax=Microbacterium sp. p3-SID131 TaxID=2916215 RepID=UPI0021A7D5E4|nr:hypothetical protein [Microbacterium sp. p3-SID131]MCT1363322.1 hypothetical protein [Microbacterium sp. p3-SID131]
MAITLGNLSIEILARIPGGEAVLIGTVAIPIDSTDTGMTVDFSRLRTIFRE